MDETDGAKMVTTRCAKCQNRVDVTGLDAGDGITCPYCGNEFRITLQFGNFLLERQLGSGGMGTVYLGRDVALNRAVAVKVLRMDLAMDDKFLSTFLKEAEITASLNHPNIVHVYAFGEQNSFYYLVMEYIDGGTLDDKIVELGSISELEAVNIGIGVAQGLEFARQRGLIHRDIKPGNIVFGANQLPKVVDFGLSRSYDSVENATGEIWGTPYYVAPEKLERLPEDFRSDLYSLGCALFHAIAGRPPFDAAEPNEVAMKHLSGVAISLKAFVPKITDMTAYAIKKAMARYPENRHESYAEFIAELEEAKRQILIPNAPSQSSNVPAAELVEPTISNKLTTWITYGVMFLVILLAGVLIWKSQILFNGQSPAGSGIYKP